MFSEDLYASHFTDNTVLITYAALFGIVIIGVLLRMTFNSPTHKEYKYTDI